MIELAQANWPLFVIAVVIGLLVAWWIFVALRRTTVETDTSDILDDGKGPALRNEALINAPPAAAKDISPKTETVEPVAVKSAAAVSVQDDPSQADDLTRIKGVGPKLRTLLNSLGVWSFAQIAEWSDIEIDTIDAQLGKFQGRIRRDSWVDQAKLLSSGDTFAYEDKFGKL